MENSSNLQGFFNSPLLLANTLSFKTELRHPCLQGSPLLPPGGLHALPSLRTPSHPVLTVVITLLTLNRKYVHGSVAPRLEFTWTPHRPFNAIIWKRCPFLWVDTVLCQGDKWSPDWISTPLVPSAVQPWP